MIPSKLQLIASAAALLVAMAVGMQIGSWKKSAEFIMVERGFNSEKNALSGEIVTLNSDISSLKSEIAKQNAAFDLLEAKADSAKDVQAEAQKRADNLAVYSKNRLDAIQAIIPTSKNCSEVLEKYWGERKLEYSF